MNPLIGFALPHAEQAPLDHLEGVGLDVGKNKQEPILGGRQGAVLIDGKPASGPGFPIKAPHRRVRVERRLEGRHQLLKLLEGQAREIQELCEARLHVGEPYTGHLWCLLSWEPQYTTINRDKLRRRHRSGQDHCRRITGGVGAAARHGAIEQLSNSNSQTPTPNFQPQRVVWELGIGRWELLTIHPKGGPLPHGVWCWRWLGWEVQGTLFDSSSAERLQNQSV